jgi:hypothetical protein
LNDYLLTVQGKFLFIVHETILRWLVRMYDDPSRQGWVPASLLERSKEEEIEQPADPIAPEAPGQRRE